MKYFDKLIFYLIILNSAKFHYCTDPLCEVDVAAPVDLTPSDLEEIIRFFKLEQVTPELVDDVLVTNENYIQQLSDYKAGADNEDINMPIEELMQKYGFPPEVHEVQTYDGYILGVHRTYKKKGPPVLLVHGAFGSADDWVTPGPKNSLAYALASEGFDVWLANARGNKHSHKHVSKSRKCADYWNFSFDEIGRYDLPAIIDYILDTTGYAKLSYVGFSQGTTASFVLCSELPEYNKKISLLVALSATVFFTHTKSPVIRLLSLNNGLTYTFLEAIGMDRILPSEDLYKLLAPIACGSNPISEAVCANFLALTFGFDRGHVNVTNLPVSQAHTTSELATKQLIHVAQLAASYRFHNFDYGESDNKDAYGSPTAPDYPVEKVTAPVAIFYSNDDWGANKTDVLHLRDALPNVVAFEYVDHYSHIDYQNAKDLKEFVNDKVVELIKKYST